MWFGEPRTRLPEKWHHKVQSFGSNRVVIQFLFETASEEVVETATSISSTAFETDSFKIQLGCSTKFQKFVLGKLYTCSIKSLKAEDAVVGFSNISNTYCSDS